jgi:hypothetical protein
MSRYAGILEAANSQYALRLSSLAEATMFATPEKAYGASRHNPLAYKTFKHKGKLYAFYTIIGMTSKPNLFKKVGKAWKKIKFKGSF